MIQLLRFNHSQGLTGYRNNGLRSIMLLRMVRERKVNLMVANPRSVDSSAILQTPLSYSGQVKIVANRNHDADVRVTAHTFASVIDGDSTDQVCRPDEHELARALHELDAAKAPMRERQVELRNAVSHLPVRGTSSQRDIDEEAFH